jgi:phage terminase small subunit
MPSKSSGDRSPRAGRNRKKKTDVKRRKASIRQKKLIEGVTKGKSVHRAALDAGYSKRSAEHAGELLSATALREAFGRFIAPPEKIAQRINEGLDATEERVIIIGRKGKEKVTVEETVDFGERRQYAALAARLTGLDPGVKIEHGGQVAHRLILENIDVAAQESA